MRGLLVYIMFFVMSEPSVLRAAEEATNEAHGEGIMGWVWKLLNFAILVFILVKFLGKPMREYFRKRTELIEKSLQEAREAKAMAERALREVEEKMAHKDEETEKIIATGRASGEAEKAEIIEEGRRMAEKIKQQARENIAMELESAKESLRAEAAELALKLAEKRIKEDLDEDAQKKLIEDSIRRLEGGN